MTKEGLQITVEKTRDYNEAFLVNTSNPVELEYITDMLKEMDISFRAEEEGKEQYISLMESSGSGISIYVDEARLSEAQELLTPLNADQQDCEEIAPQEEELIDEQVYEEHKQRIENYRKRFLYTVIIGASILPALGLVLIFIVSVYMVIMHLFG